MSELSDTIMTAIGVASPWMWPAAILTLALRQHQAGRHRRPGAIISGTGLWLDPSTHAEAAHETRPPSRTDPASIRAWT